MLHSVVYIKCDVTASRAAYVKKKISIFAAHSLAQYVFVLYIYNRRRFMYKILCFFIFFLLQNMTLLTVMKIFVTIGCMLSFQATAIIVLLDDMRWIDVLIT